jgi:hypothetical protein
MQQVEFQTVLNLLGRTMKVILIAYISANIGATNKLPSTGLLHQDVIDIF